MEPRRLCRLADSHHFDKEQDPKPHFSEFKFDADPLSSENRDADRKKVMRIRKQATGIYYKKLIPYDNLVSRKKSDKEYM
jgi:hypothetical protein